MKTIKLTPLFVGISMACTLTNCDGQTTKKEAEVIEVGGRFENSEFMYIGIPNQLNAVDTSDGWDLAGQKLLITGTIRKADGKTPAPDVVLYYYHTNTQGVYENRGDLDPRVIRHGYIRGWVKSDQMGRYSIYTVKPGSYPNTTFAAHIHIAVKEPNNFKEYYLDDLVFDDDPLLTNENRKKLVNRGGSGIIKLQKRDELFIAEHDVFLGLNIPGYPRND